MMGDLSIYAVMLCECVSCFKFLYSLTSSIIMMSKKINYSGSVCELAK